MPAAPAVTPVGLWRTIDDRSGEARSLVRITAQPDGTLNGRVERILDPTHADATCERCEDERKGEPIVGMEIIRGLRKNETGEDSWVGGKILNPEEGKVYSMRATPADGGRRLEVRGYLGLPLLGRTQTWIREPQ